MEMGKSNNKLMQEKCQIPFVGHDLDIDGFRFLFRATINALKAASSITEYHVDSIHCNLHSLELEPLV